MRKSYLTTLIFFIATVFLISSINGQEISTIGEIYDFEIGDEFHITGYHYVNYGGPGTVTQWRQIDKIIGKFYSPYSDTLFYNTYRRYTENEYPEPGWTYYDTIILEYYTNLESLIYNGDIDTVFSDSSLYNGRLINGAMYDDSYGLLRHRFVNGCGLFYYKYYNHYGFEEEFVNKIVYFNKNGEEWGNPITITNTIQEEFNRFSITLYPNPTDGKVFINYEGEASKNYEIKIFDTQGRLVLHNIQNSNEIHHVNVSNLNAGIYILKLILDTKIVERKFIKR